MCVRRACSKRGRLGTHWCSAGCDAIFLPVLHGSTAPAGTTSKFGHPFTFSFAGLPHHCIMKMLVLHTCAHGFHSFSKPVWAPLPLSTDTSQQHDAPHIAHLHNRPTLPETRTQPATGTDRRTPTTRRHSAWASPGRRTQTATREACFKCGDMKALAVYILVLLFTCCALPLPLLLVLHIIFTFKCDYTSSERILT